MVNKFTLRYLPVAVEDLESIFDWIANDSKTHAAAFVEKIDQRIGSLRSHPFLGRLPRDEKLKNSGYRILVVESYLVFYRVYKKTIGIHRVIHGSRNLDDIL
jgi:toxin ParE1/3/4